MWWCGVSFQQGRRQKKVEALRSFPVKYTNSSCEYRSCGSLVSQDVAKSGPLVGLCVGCLGGQGVLRGLGLCVDPAIRHRNSLYLLSNSNANSRWAREFEHFSNSHQCAMRAMRSWWKKLGHWTTYYDSQDQTAYKNIIISPCQYMIRRVPALHQLPFIRARLNSF